LAKIGILTFSVCKLLDVDYDGFDSARAVPGGGA
jgi:hypothetical protein